MDKERMDRLATLPGFIVLIKKPGDDTLYGPVENSFSLGVEPNRTQLFWSGTAHSIIGTHNLDGKEDALHSVEYWKEKYPDWEFAIYDARDSDNLPVVLNWELWLDAHELSSETFSGIKNKYEARNLRFRLKSEPKDETTKAPSLKMTFTAISQK